MRCVTKYDADAVAELDALLFPDNNFNETTIAAEITLGMGLVVEDEDAIVAYALVRDDGHLLDLIRLGVRQSHQRKGLGAQLLKHLLKMGREVMLTVRPDNLVAIHLYQSFGFEFVGRLRNGAGWVMRRFDTTSPTSL